MTNFIFPYSDVCNFHSVCERAIYWICFITCTVRLLQHLTVRCLFTFADSVHIVKATVWIINYIPMPFNEQFTNNRQCSHDSVERRGRDVNITSSRKNAPVWWPGKRIVSLQPMQVVKGDQNWYPVPGGIAGSPCRRGVVNTVDCFFKWGVGRQADNLSP